MLKIVIKYYLVLVIKYSTQNVVAFSVNSYTDSKLFKNVVGLSVDIKKPSNQVTPNTFLKSINLNVYNFIPPLTITLQPFGLDQRLDQPFFFNFN